MAKDTKGQVENILAELGKKIDLLIEETKGARKDVREDVEAKIKELKNKKAKIEKEFAEYKEQSGDKWSEAKIHLFAAMQELRKAIEAVFKDKSETKL